MAKLHSYQIWKDTFQFEIGGNFTDCVSWPHQKPNYYSVEVTSTALLFKVRTAGSAFLELAQDKYNTNAIVITMDHIIILNDRYGGHVEQNTPGLLTVHEYRCFWLFWNSGYIRMGKDGDPVPLIKLKINRQFFHTFIRLRCGNDHPVYWKVLVGFSLTKPILKPISSGQLRWKRYAPGVPWPNDALQAGHQNEPLYIMRTVHEGSLTPGKFMLSSNRGYITWKGQHIEKIYVEILCGFDAVWVQTAQNFIPPNVFIGGRTEDQRAEHLYIGRVKCGDHVIPGKVQCSRNACFVPYNGREIVGRSYEILTVPQEKYWRSLPHLPSHPGIRI